MHHELINHLATMTGPNPGMVTFIATLAIAMATILLMATDWRSATHTLIIGVILIILTVTTIPNWTRNTYRQGAQEILEMINNPKTEILEATPSKQGGFWVKIGPREEEKKEMILGKEVVVTTNPKTITLEPEIVKWLEEKKIFPGTNPPRTP
jgi:hypothetical protein